MNDPEANGPAVAAVDNAREAPTYGPDEHVLGDTPMAYQLTALATLAMVATYMWTGIMVGSARVRHKVAAPATEGPDDFNRVYRAHVNTLEQFAAMVPALWVFAYAVGDRWAALLGVVWVLGRILYVTGYARAADQRGIGFGVTFSALAVAVVGAAGALLWSALR